MCMHSSLSTVLMYDTQTQYSAQIQYYNIMVRCKHSNAPDVWADQSAAWHGNTGANVDVWVACHQYRKRQPH